MADHPLTRNEGFGLAGLVLTMVALMAALNIWLLSTVWEMRGVVLVTQNDVANVKNRMETFGQLVSRMESTVNSLQSTKDIGEQLKGTNDNLSDLRALLEKRTEK